MSQFESVPRCWSPDVDGRSLHLTLCSHYSLPGRSRGAGGHWSCKCLPDHRRQRFRAASSWSVRRRQARAHREAPALCSVRRPRCSPRLRAQRRCRYHLSRCRGLPVSRYRHRRREGHRCRHRSRCSRGSSRRRRPPRQPSSTGRCRCLPACRRHFSRGA